MSLHRCQVKLFAAADAQVDLRAVVPVFHRWIREARIPADELAIDVADYRHVHDGPGVMLVGHATDYGVERGGGRLGLLYVRKRGFEGDVAALVRDSIARAAYVAGLLEQEPSLAGLRFDLSAFEVRLADRLLAPNTDAGFATHQAALAAVAAELGGATLARVETDPRALLTLTLSSPRATTAAELATLAAA